MYFIANQATLQVTAQKAVYRFFKSLEEHPRFCSKFVQKVRMGIEPELLGVSTISWWNMVEQQFGKFANTKPFYTMFRNCLKSDLMLSDRLEATGL